MSQVQQFDPMKKKDEQLLQAKSSNLTQWKQKDQNYCRQSPATWPTIAFVYKIRNFNENRPTTAFVTIKEILLRKSFF